MKINIPYKIKIKNKAIKMNKFALVLILSLIAFTMGNFNIDDFNTEPYYSYDWLKKKEKTFDLTFKESVKDNNNIFCYLYNTSKVCLPTCAKNNKVLTCTLKGEKCKADADNPTFKYYYAVYCSESTNDGFNKDSKADALLTYLKNPANNPSTSDVRVTIAVCSGSYLKYSLFLLSLLIL